MKLIDVHNFLKQYSDQVCGDTIDAIDLRLALLKEPTIKAIPVEWLKKRSMGHSLMAAAYICFMIHEWEAENETN